MESGEPAVSVWMVALVLLAMSAAAWAGMKYGQKHSHLNYFAPPRQDERVLSGAGEEVSPDHGMENENDGAGPSQETTSKQYHEEQIWEDLKNTQNHHRVVKFLKSLSDRSVGQLENELWEKVGRGYESFMRTERGGIDNLWYLAKKEVRRRQEERQHQKARIILRKVVENDQTR